MKGKPAALNLDKPLQYVARISHGKDSLKMLDVIVSRGLPLDRIVTTDVWATDTIRGELPEMVEFKARADEWIWRKYRIEVEHLCAMRDGKRVSYERCFYTVPKRRSGNGKRDGLPYGFPILKSPWCKKELKIRVGTERRNMVSYIGIAADEPKRHGQLTPTKRAPLVEFGIDEGLCGLYCQHEGILSPTYLDSSRDGCWFCNNQRVGSLRKLRKKYPDLWALLLKWDADSPTTFKPDGRTVRDYDRRFEMEDERLISADDRVFRWEMLEDYTLTYRIF